MNQISGNHKLTIKLETADKEVVQGQIQVETYITQWLTVSVQT